MNIIVMLCNCKNIDIKLMTLLIIINQYKIKIIGLSEIELDEENNSNQVGIYSRE